MRQPLAVARANIRADMTSMHVRKIRVEARIPYPHAFSIFTAQVADISNIAAKTCWAHHRAVRAREASLGEIFPARVVEPIEQDVR